MVLPSYVFHCLLPARDDRFLRAPDVWNRKETRCFPEPRIRAFVHAFLGGEEKQRCPVTPNLYLALPGQALGLDG